MNIGDELRAGERQDVVVALEITAVIREALGTECRLRQPFPLHHGAHGPIEQDHAFLEQPPQPADTLGTRSLIRRLDGERESRRTLRARPRRAGRRVLVQSNGLSGVLATLHCNSPAACARSAQERTGAAGRSPSVRQIA